MRYSNILLAAGIGQACAQAWSSFADLANGLAARDTLYDGALRTLYARVADAEAYNDDDIASLFARTLVRRVPPSDKPAKMLINAVGYANDVNKKVQSNKPGPPPPGKYPSGKEQEFAQQNNANQKPVYETFPKTPPVKVGPPQMPLGLQKSTSKGSGSSSKGGK